MKIFSYSDLRVRLALSIALPVLALMGIFSFWQYQREAQLIQTDMEKDGQMAADVMLLGLRHAMVLNDQNMVQSMVSGSITTSEDIKREIILDHDGIVKADSLSSSDKIGTKLDVKTAGCYECHQEDSTQTMPSTLTMTQNGVDTLRIVSLIENSSECYQCHDSQQKNLGVLILDISSQEQQKVTQQNILLDFGLSILATLSISITIFFLIDFLATRRIKAFMKPLSSYASGNYNVRLPVSKADDELDHLAITFNQMIAEIEMHIKEESKRGELLSKAIVEERERIARELHDSLPQLLAYLSTKIGAIYLFVQKGKKREALSNLRDLEEASRNLLSDVRDAIHGLRASRLLAAGLTHAIENYLDQFRELCRIPVAFSSDPQLTTITLSPEIDVQALRIVQEALSNIRKHSQATKASVQVQLRNEHLVLTIEDNGIGFDPAVRPSERKTNYGLQTMRERTESLSGKFVIQSKSGKGTTITVSLPLIIQDK